MFETMQTGPSTIKFGQNNVAPKVNERIEKIKKDGKPGPTSFEVEKSLEACALRSSVNQKFTKAKNVNMFENHLKLKKKTPGVGTYKTEKAYDAISGGPTCYARKR